MFILVFNTANKSKMQTSYYFSQIKSLALGIIYLVRTQNFSKNNISYPLIRKRTRAYQGVRNVSFSKNFA